MIPVEAALAQVLALVRPLETEVVPLRHAAGRVLAAAARADRDQPPFAAASMDGYAVGGPVTPGQRLHVVGESRAGAGFEGHIGPGEAVRIFTGAPMPGGADRVVIQEDVTRTDALVTIGDGADTAPHVRPAGSDFAAGFTLDAPRLLRPVDVALLAAMNVAEIAVRRRPVVALIATGDELVMPGTAPAAGQIVASNTFALAAMAEAAGAEARLLPIARDDPDALAHVLGLAAGCDLVVTVGGASVGDHDLVGPVTGRMGMERAFYRVAIRPGKPLMAGRLGASALLGLPGNPVSAIVCGHVFLLPMLRAMLGLPPERPALAARLACDLPANGPRAHYMRARLLPPADGALPGIAPFEDQDSARLRLLSEADALLIRPVADPPRRAGDIVRHLPL